MKCVAKRRVEVSEENYYSKQISVTEKSSMDRKIAGVRPGHQLNSIKLARAHSSRAVNRAHSSRAAVCKSVELLARLGYHLLVLSRWCSRYAGLAYGLWVGPGDSGRGVELG